MPGAKRSRVLAPASVDEPFRVWVPVPSEDGRANTAMLKVMAEFLKVPIGALTLVSGHHYRGKVVQVASSHAGQVSAWLVANQKGEG
jgi:uncharacterized protein YggU (UPF0235/DUF167 family)